MVHCAMAWERDDAIARRTACCLEQLAILVRVAEAKVNNLDALVEVKEKILGLEITVHNIEPRDVLDSAEDLLEKLAGFFLLHALVLHDVIE